MDEGKRYMNDCGIVSGAGVIGTNIVEQVDTVEKINYFLNLFLRVII